MPSVSDQGILKVRILVLYSIARFSDNLIFWLIFFLKVRMSVCLMKHSLTKGNDTVFYLKIGILNFLISVSYRIN